MMAVTSTIDTYDQYQRDTTRFVFWLVVTTRSYGHTIVDPTAFFQELVKPDLPKPTRLNGTARK